MRRQSASLYVVALWHILELGLVVCAGRTGATLVPEERLVTTRNSKN
jgi:hypothetical protein